MKNDKSTKTAGKLHNPDGSFAKGHPPIGGRPKGKRDFKTDFEEAVKKMAEKQGITLSEARQSLLVKGFIEARKGDFKFWQYIHDRLYGKEEEKVNADVKYIITRGDAHKEN